MATYILTFVALFNSPYKLRTGKFVKLSPKHLIISYAHPPSPSPSLGVKTDSISPLFEYIRVLKWYRNMNNGCFCSTRGSTLTTNMRYAVIMVSGGYLGPEVWHIWCLERHQLLYRRLNDAHGIYASIHGESLSPMLNQMFNFQVDSR